MDSCPKCRGSWRISIGGDAHAQTYCLCAYGLTLAQRAAAQQAKAESAAAPAVEDRAEQTEGIAP